MKIYQAVQKLLVVDRQTGDLISILSFLESRLISSHNVEIAEAIGITTGATYDDYKTPLKNSNS
jgi:hypothetical protein